MARTASTSFPGARCQRGVSLVEALVAFLVTAIGMLAIVSMQTTLRFNSDIAKQRSEAVRLAQEELEAMRSFSVLETPDPPEDGVRAYAEIALGDSERDIEDFTTNTTYRLSSTVLQDDDYDILSVRVTVSWIDRAGQTDTLPGSATSVTFDTTIYGIDPQLSGLLSLAANGLPTQRSLSRIPNLPLAVRDLGDGRSAYKPEAGGSVVWIFNNATGIVTSLCSVPAEIATENIVVTDLSGCSTIRGYLLAGFVRFATGDLVNAAVAENPTSLALGLDMAITFGKGTYDTPLCYDDSPDSPGTQTAVQYLCLVFPDKVNKTNLDMYSGRLKVAPIGWAYGLTADEYRLCRYSADYDASGSVENAEHPADYVDVKGNLVNQNFLVVRGDNTCPTDVAADPANNDLVNSNTLQLLPVGT